MWELTIHGHFAAAHSLRNFKGRCESLHGHNWRVELTVAGERLDQAGLVMDFGELKALLGQALDALDHRYLNEVPPFDRINPSSELIARYLFEAIAPALPAGVVMRAVAAWESENAKATYLGPASA